MKTLDVLRVYVCPYCGRMFNTQRGLTKHLSTAHSDAYVLVNASPMFSILFRIEKRVEKLESEVKLLRKLITSIENKIENSLALSSNTLEVRPPAIVSHVEVLKTAGKASESLPSYARGNPWLSVLASRGR